MITTSSGRLGADLGPAVPVDVLGRAGADHGRHDPLAAGPVRHADDADVGHPGQARTAFSRSAGWMLKPARMISSLRRPAMRR